jgi:hypothetical protein
MVHPNYPSLLPKITPISEYPKMNIDSLMEIYDQYTAIGLYVMPKKRKQKVPLTRYWEVGAALVTDRSRVISDQQDYDSSGWCIATGSRSNRLYVLDFDTAEIAANGIDPWTLYQWVQSISESAFVLGSPSGGVHVYYRIPDDKALPGNITPTKGVDGRGEGGQVVTRGGFNRYDDTADKLMAAKKGVPSGHCDTYRELEDGDYSFIPEMSDELYEWLTASTRSKTKPAETEGEKYARTVQGQARMEAHIAQTSTEKERITLECLSFILPNWGNRSYGEWIQMWMSAHHSSAGSAKVRDFIVESQYISWPDGQDGRLKFRHAWDTYVREDDGYTAASLFYLARQHGWLTRTGYEINDKLVEPINVRYVTDWLETLERYPELLLLMSQTGSGKTHGFKKVWEDLGQPKAVIFVPSVRLATELANTLRTVHGLPVTLYIDNATGRRKMGVEMVDAQILVTTLQTFALKIYKAGVPMNRYGLVYIEECNQLIEQFSRGGGGVFSSQVSEQEARAGFECLQEAFRDCRYVWGVDATMTRSSYDLFEALKVNRSVRVVRNEWVQPKSLVTMLEDKAEAYQTVFKALDAGKKVVVAADTAATAEEVEQVMRLAGVLEGKKSLVITRHTERDPNAIRFMDDVNAGALEYDLVCYNSAMASGVSITSVAPDVLVQFCMYLTPRTNLQILNRYRQQNEVFCYYRKGENIYSKQAGEILDDAERRAMIESGMVNIPLAARTDMALLRAHITALSVGDEQQQLRAPRDIYRQLLNGDGRRVLSSDSTMVADIVDDAMQETRAMRKERKEFLAQTWPNTPPIDREHPALPEYTDDQIAQGEIHAKIQYILKGNIPESLPPAYVYNVVQEFAPHITALAAFVDQNGALRRSEVYLADRGKALTSLTNHITLIRVLATLHHLYHTLDDKLDEQVLAERAPAFMKALWPMRDEYDSVIVNPRQQFNAVLERATTDEDRAADFAKILLKRLGLRQRTEREGRKPVVQISNIEAAREFLSWRKTDLVLTDEPVIMITTRRQSQMDLYAAMTDEQKGEVMGMLLDGTHTDFEVAIRKVASGLDPY